MLGTETADDHHIRGVDAKLRQLRADQRNAERQGGADMRRPRIIVVVRERARSYRHIHLENSILRQRKPPYPRVRKLVDLTQLRPKSQSAKP